MGKKIGKISNKRRQEKGANFSRVSTTQKKQEQSVSKRTTKDHKKSERIHKQRNIGSKRLQIGREQGSPNKKIKLSNQLNIKKTKVQNSLIIQNKSQSFNQKELNGQILKAKNILKKYSKKSQLQKRENQDTPAQNALRHQTQITASAFGVYNQKLQPIIQKNSNSPNKIASLTKLITLYTVLNLIQKQCYLTIKDLSQIYVRITVQATKTGGSSSELTPKQWMTIHDLLYGLIIPSGNDASLALAHALGGVLANKQKYLVQIQKKKQLDVTNCGRAAIQKFQQIFVDYMNKIAKEQFRLQTSYYTNPHGLDHPQAHSSIKDLLKILQKIYQNSFCRQILSTKKYNGKLYVFPDKNGYPSDTDWINTDKLLWKQGYVGGKTGQTPEAGNCLATIFKPSNKNQIYYIIVLGCKQLNDRFSDTEKLVKLL